MAVADPRQSLRLQVLELVGALRPPWTRLAAQGRSELARYAPEEAVQCLRECGLLDDVDEETVSWWDQIAGERWADRHEESVATGRKGERLSWEYEARRTGTRPEWVALEHAGAGYDLRSQISAEDDTPLYIEVKASERPWEYARFYLPRSEWFLQTGCQHAVVHLWSLHGDDVLHAIVGPRQLAKHVADDQGLGEWQVVKIPFSVSAPENSRDAMPSS